MKLDRTNGRGKYAIVNLRGLEQRTDAVKNAINFLHDEGVLSFGEPGTDDEFFVIKLRDQFSRNALRAYAEAADAYDPEYASDVQDLADRSGLAHPHCKVPD